ncbi:hypothetical protein COL5a_007704 [Colletotrichum fioriniae]|nr:hypothetical protein COL5a_007704 [Colletotrichum fioriniae]
MAPPGQLPRVRSAEASIEKGRAAYADQRFRVALEHFTLVAGNCPCSSPSGGGPTSSGGGSGSSSGGRTSRSLKGLGAAGSRGGGGAGPDGGDASGNGHSPAQQRRRRERCTCRDFAQAAARHRRERGSVYAEATKECKCGAEKTWGRCHREGHVQALDYRAACFEKMGKLDMARRDAEWLLEIAPRRLEPPRVSFLKTLRKRTGGGARSLVIPNAHAFQLNETKWLSLIQTTNPRMMTRLEIGAIKRNLESGDWGYKLPPKPLFFEGLTHLGFSFRVDRPNYQSTGGAQPFVRQFVERARENIERISLFSMHLNDLGWPELPRLKILQLTGPLTSTLNQLTPERRIDPNPQFALARSTPNLEQIHMDNFGVFTGLDSLAPPEDCWSLWPGLQVIKLGKACGALSMGDKRHFPPLHPSSFRVLDARAALQSNHGDWLPQQLPLDYSGYEAAESLVTYPNLERFWMPKLPLSVDLATVLLEPAVRSGRLRELGLCWRQEPGQFFPGALDWLRGSVSVRTFGFFNFDFESHENLTRDPAQRGRGIDSVDLLFGFLQSFPNLEVLELHSDLCDPMRLGAIIERVAILGRLKKVYQRALTGVAMDQLRTFCGAHGVEVVYGSWEAEFPVPLEPLAPVEAEIGE